MKNLLILIVFVAFITQYACMRNCGDAMIEEPPIIYSACIDAKIAAWKLDNHSWAIYQVNAFPDTLFWFVDAGADGGEYMFNIACDAICITDIELAPSNIMMCDSTEHAAKIDTIWKK